MDNITDSLSNENFVELLYEIIHKRKYDENGKKHYVKQLNEFKLNKNDLINIFINSDEFNQNVNKFVDFSNSIHKSRKIFIKSLPEAKNIIDLGGIDLGSGSSALFKMGYHYDFEKITVIDLPNEKRHERYRSNSFEKNEKISFLYRDMIDLDDIETESVDMVFAGESVEHIEEYKFDILIKEISRILKYDGFFCFDTPNKKITRIQQESFIDPDHKIEYSNEEIIDKFKNKNFKLISNFGLQYIGDCDRESFDKINHSKNIGMYCDVEKSYLLSYVWKKIK
jgi:ubiquinone/menaquinone biosynthesis C-methylase UbiE